MVCRSTVDQSRSARAWKHTGSGYGMPAQDETPQPWTGALQAAFLLQIA